MQAQAYALKSTAIRAPASRNGVEDRDDVTLIGVAKTYHRECEIFGEGDAADFVYKVISGAVRSFRLLSDGRRQITHFYLPGDVFGVEFGKERRAGAEALSDAVVVVSRRSAVAADFDQSMRLWRQAVRELQRSEDHALTLGRRSATERIVSFLLDLADRLDADDEFELPMTRQDIADYLGLTIETVSRTMTQLQADRLIQLQGCRRVRFPRRGALEELCE
ncbi:MAG TPA: helix-turn-helix domain-containing protein [Caulobacteraceae bacterium]|nr:helix-turn-helix domain-containing protein [Caulobacteraceae bacterium]